MIEKYVPNFSYSLAVFWDRRQILRRLQLFRWQMFRNANPGLGGKVRMFRALIVWPFRLLSLAPKYVHAYGDDVARIHGIPKWLQFYRLMHVGLVHSVIPHNFYRYDLYLPKNFKSAFEFYFDEDSCEVEYYLSKRYDSEFIANKALQTELFEQAGLAVIPTIAEVSNGSFLRCSGEESVLKNEMLFLKPRDGGCGVGHELWKRQPDGHFKAGSGDPLGPAEFMERLKRISNETPYLIQPRIENDPRIQDLSNGGLMPIRIVTGVSEDNEVVPIYATLCMPVENSACVNLCKGGLCSMVDMETGELESARTAAFANFLVDEHPVTNARIKGRVVPDWETVKALACDGHRAVIARQDAAGERPNVLLGWDIARTPSGPIIIETNMKFGDTYQMAGMGPVGTTRFAELLHHHLERLEPEYGPI